MACSKQSFRWLKANRMQIDDLSLIRRFLLSATKIIHIALEQTHGKSCIVWSHIDLTDRLACRPQLRCPRTAN